MRNALTRIVLLYGIATPIFVGGILARDHATGTTLQAFQVVEKAADIAAVGIVAALATAAALIDLLLAAIYLRAIVAVLARAPSDLSLIVGLLAVVCWPPFGIRLGIEALGDDIFRFRTGGRTNA